jgi:hypothetical protein
MKIKLQTYAAIAIAALLLAAPNSVRADADWNAIAVQATITAARPGPTGALDIAMVQVAELQRTAEF